MIEDNKPEIRLRVDWDNDGFLNGRVPAGTPLNKIPNAAYAAGAKCAYYQSGQYFRDTEVKDVDTYGFTYFEANMSVAETLIVGNKATFFTPNGASLNLARLDDYLVSLRDIKLTDVDVTDKPYDFKVYQAVKSVGASAGSGTNITVSPIIPSDALPVNDSYVLVMWARIKADTTFPQYEVKLTLDGHLTSADRNQLLIDETQPNDTWSDWTQLYSVIEKSQIDESWRINLFGSDSGGLQPPFTMYMQVGGFMVISGSGNVYNLDDGTVVDDMNVSTPAGDYWDSINGYYDVRSNISGVGTRFFEIETGYTIPANSDTFMAVDCLAKESGGNVGVYFEFINEADDSILGTTGSAVLTTSFASKHVVAYVNNTTGSDIDVNVRVYLDTTGNGFGLQMYDFEVTIVDLPNQYYEFPDPPDEAEGYVRLESGTAHNYSFQMWRDTAGSSSVDLEVFGIDLVTAERVSLVTDTITVTADRQRFNVTIPSQADDYMFLCEFTTADSITLAIKANQITEGTEPYVFTVGDIPELDDISSYVKSADWKMGRSDFDSPIAYEGTLELVVNNDSRNFSINNVSSPYYGYMRKNLKVLFEVKNGQTWTPIWTGWTSEFEIITGRNSSREMTISCEQGIYRLRDGEFSYRPREAQRVSDVVALLVANSGWRSAKTPFAFTLGFNALLGISTYMQSTEDIFTRIDTTHEILELSGMDWGKETSVDEALKDVLEAENAKLWLDREGGLVLRSREHIINASDNSVKDLTLDLEVQEADYTYADKIINRVEVIFEPKNTVTREAIWNTKNSVRVPRRNARNIYLNSTVKIPMHFTFEERRQRTITKVYSRMADFDINVTNANTGQTVDSITNSIWVSVSSDGDTYYELQLRNEFEFPVLIDVTVYGDYIEGGQPQTYTVEDVEAQEFIGAVHKETIKVAQLDDFEKARNMAKWLLKRYAYPTGKFPMIEYVIDDAALLNELLSWNLGDILKVSEAQTGETDVYHVIIAEEGSYAAGDAFRITLNLDHADNQYYNKVGYSTAAMGTANHAPEKDILKANLFAADKADLRRVAFLSEDGEEAIEMRSYRLGGTVWFGNSDVYQWGKVGVDSAKYQEQGSGEVSSYYDNNNYERSFYNRKRLVGESSFVSYERCWGIWNKNGSTSAADWTLKENYPDEIIRLSAAVLNTGAGVNVYWELNDDQARLNSTPNASPILVTNAAPAVADQATALYDDVYHYTEEFIQKTPDYPFFMRMSTSSFSARVMDGAYMNLLRLNNTAVKENTQYYVNLWGATPSGKTLDIEVVILEHDNLTMHTVPLTITDTYGKFGGTFTTTASLSDNMATVWFRFVDITLNIPVYMTGFAITESDVDSISEANERNDLAAHIFV